MHPALLRNKKAIEDWSAWNSGDISGDCLDKSRLGDCTEGCFQTLPFCALTYLASRFCQHVEVLLPELYMLNAIHRDRVTAKGPSCHWIM